jgi:ABC-2 type transport system ATP-binding protein
MRLPNSPETISDPAISVRGLTKVYGRGKNELRAVNDVSFDIDSGTAVGVLGPNGAGKTSILKMMLGVIAPTSGSVQGTSMPNSVPSSR